MGTCGGFSLGWLVGTFCTGATEGGGGGGGFEGDGGGILEGG